MNNTQVVTLRMPNELKKRLEQEAKCQGVSMNQLANYLLNVQVTQLEMVSALEARLSRKSADALRKKARHVLKKVPRREVPDWDRIR